MNVLSCFDGIGCGRLALERAGVPFDLYLSSEIDKYAIAVSQYHWENYTNLGDIKGIKAEDLPRIDLLIGGSPCQSFSLAGNRLNFDDPRGQLFFEYVRIFKEILAINPRAKFLLENVKMAKAHKEAFTQVMGEAMACPCCGEVGTLEAIRD